ncbi:MULTISPECIES: hypothetical protein [Listeria]|uniref:hypothetical protein n=1 Tax=Listeria TaxID=1637 RepID=UPI000B587352|nr:MULTISPECIES: hypothetical protein [Listeria]
MLERQVKPKESKDTLSLLKLYFESEGVHPDDGIHQLYQDYLNQHGISESMIPHLRKAIHVQKELHQTKHQLMELQQQIGGQAYGSSEEV